MKNTPSFPCRRRAIARVLASCSLTLGVPHVWAQVTNNNDAINKAGRQRMLSQRMAKAWLALGLQIDTPRAQRILADSLALFDRQNAELRAYAPTAEIRTTYAALESAWSNYKTALVGALPTRESTPELIAQETRVLQLAHQGTVQLEKYADKPTGHLVNVAGRQRMLSQRMAKFYLAQSWQTNVPGADTELKKAQDEFVAGLATLRGAKEATPAILQQLDLAQQQWVFFEHALQRGAGNQRSADVFSTSENILQVMDRVTGLYASLPT